MSITTKAKTTIDLIFRNVKILFFEIKKPSSEGFFQYFIDNQG